MEASQVRVNHAIRIAFPIVLLAVVMLVMWAPHAHEMSHLDTSLEKTGEWRDPSAAGADLRFDVSPDGSRLLLVGYGAPNELRVTDRSLKTLSVLAPPGTPFAVKGAVWSDTGRYILVWGRVADESVDALTVYDAATFAAVPDLVPRGSVPLDTIDAAHLVAIDRILALAGSSPNGTERVLFCEVNPFLLLKDAPARGEGRVVSIDIDGRELVCVDDAGYLVVYSTNNWTFLRRYHDLPGAPTAVCISELFPTQWAVGDSTGNLTIWWGWPMVVWLNLSLGPGPIQAIALVQGDSDIALVGVPAPGGGSRLQLWSLVHAYGRVPTVVGEVGTDATVTMLGPDPRAGTGVIAGFSDGTLRTYRLSVVYDVEEESPYGSARDAMGGYLPIALIALIIWLAWEVRRWRRGERR